MSTVSAPHRDQELVELCRVCKEPARAHCRRCGTPLCGEHEPGDPERRCDRCEEHFAESTAWLQKAADGHVYATFGRPFVVFIALTFFIPLGALLGANGGVSTTIVMAGVATTLMGIWYAKTPPRKLEARRQIRKKRRRFLRKRARRLLE